MSKKELNLNKLSLPKRNGEVKKTPPASQEINIILERIHEQPKEIPKKLVRVTVDLPEDLHKKIKLHLIENGLRTIRDYFINLALKDLP